MFQTQHTQDIAALEAKLKKAASKAIAPSPIALKTSRPLIPDKKVSKHVL